MGHVSLRIVVAAATSGALLEAQARLLRKYVAEPFDLLVVNDASPQEHFSNNWRRGVSAEIRTAAHRVGARHIRCPRLFHYYRERIFPDVPDRFSRFNNANTRCADAVQLGVSYLLREGDGPILLMDADMVPFKAFSSSEFLAGAPIWGVPQTRENAVQYLWNGIILFDPGQMNEMSLFSLDCGEIDGQPVDVGGMLYRILRRNKVGYFETQPAANPDCYPSLIRTVPDPVREFMLWDRSVAQGLRVHRDDESEHILESARFRMSEVIIDTFFHLGSGANWEVREAEQARQRLDKFIEAAAAL